LRELHRRRAHRRRTARNGRLAAHAASRVERRLEQSVEHRTGMRTTLLPRVAHLSVDLSFTEDHRIEAARDAKQVRDCVTVAPDVAVSRGVRAKPLGQRTPGNWRRVLFRLDEIDLGAVTGREQHGLPCAARRSHRVEGRDDLGCLVRHPLANLDGRATMVQANERQRHSATLAANSPDSTSRQNSVPTSECDASIQRSRRPPSINARRSVHSSRTAAPYDSPIDRAIASRIRDAAAGTPPVLTATTTSPLRWTAGVTKLPGSGASTTLTRRPPARASAAMRAFRRASLVAATTSSASPNCSLAYRFRITDRRAARTASASSSAEISGATTLTVAPASTSAATFRAATAPPPTTRADTLPPSSISGSALTGTARPKGQPRGTLRRVRARRRKPCSNTLPRVGPATRPLLGRQRCR